MPFLAGDSISIIDNIVRTIYVSMYKMANARELLALGKLDSESESRSGESSVQDDGVRDQLMTGSDKDFSAPSTNSILSLIMRRYVYVRTVRFWKRFRHRLFKGKGAFLMLVQMVLVNIVYFLSTSAIIEFLTGTRFLSVSEVSTLQTAMWSSYALVSGPFAGFIADVCLGRYLAIRWSMILVWIALAVLSLLAALYEGGYITGEVTTFVLPFPPLLLLLVGFGGLRANMIPFGIDQLQGPSSEQISSYIYWQYWCENIGALLGYITLSQIEQGSAYLLIIVATVVITVAICLYMIFNNLFDKTRESRNPLGLVIRIIFYAATAKRGPPRTRRAFRYGEIPPSRIDLAKVDYDGKFTHEQVEDVKTFCLILLVYVSLAGASLAYGGFYTMISQEVLLSNTSEYQYIYNVYQNLANFVNAGTIIVFIPFFNNFLFPLLGNYTPNLRKRIAIGILFEIGAGLLSVVIEATNSSSLIILPMVPLSIAEILILVTGIEFVYAQSPYAMKGMLFGLLFCAFGLYNGLSAALFTMAPDSKTLCLWSSKSIFSNCVLWYFVFYTIVAVIGFVVYVFTAAVYRNRSRDVVVNYNAIVAEYYEKSHIERPVND